MKVDTAFEYEQAIEVSVRRRQGGRGGAAIDVTLLAVAGALSGCGTISLLGPRVEMATGVAHRMSIADVERVVRAECIVDTSALGRRAASVRVTRVRLVAPFEVVADTADGLVDQDRVQHRPHQLAGGGGRNVPRVRIDVRDLRSQDATEWPIDQHPLRAGDLQHRAATLATLSC